MEKSKILIFTDWYEPGFKAGGPIRSCVNFAAHMKDDYAIFIFTGDRDLGDDQSYPQIETNEWIEQQGIQIYYASPAAQNWENIYVQIKKIDPDYVYLNSMYSRCFTIYPLLMKRLALIRGQVVLAPRGMLQQGAIQFKPGKKKIFLKALNFLGIPKRILAHATDEQEKKDIFQHLPKIKSVKVIPNFSPAVLPSLEYVKKNIRELNAIFISRVAPKKNILFLLSLLKQLSGDIKFSLIIRGEIEDKDYWKKCVDTIHELPQNISVRYEGSIKNDEVIPLIQQNHLFILPTLGENFGHAIFEALSAGRPVLISDQTPWRNLSSRYAGWDLPLSEQDAFVRVLQQVADMDDTVFQQWCAGAWKYAKDFSEGSHLKEKYRELFS